MGTDLIRIQDDIRAYFEWSLERDIDSANRLLSECSRISITDEIWNEENREKTRRALQKKIVRGSITVLGAAAEAIDVDSAVRNNEAIIAADGAVGVLTESTRPEDAWDSLICVVTDGDGDMSHLLLAAEKGVPFVIHAHGDNHEQWRCLLEALALYKNPIVLTHQTPLPISGMHNPGGFTDGDRAVCFAISIGAGPENLILRGFSTDVIGRWTGSTNPERKMRKLEWMKRILDLLGVKF